MRRHIPPTQPKLRQRRRSLSADTSEGTQFPNPCLSLPEDRAGWTQSIESSDDGFSELQLLTFPFNFFGTEETSLFINTNGYLSFRNELLSSSSDPMDFPSSLFGPVVAPFWADVDTRGNQSGLVWHTSEGHKFAVAWDQVGYFDSHSDLTNTFQVVLSDGNDASMGLGNNMCFCYGDMQWTAGDSNETSGGFGFPAATVGANKGDGVHFVQVGRFGQPGSDYDGANGSVDGIDYLDQQSFCFNTAETIPSVTFPNPCLTIPEDRQGWELTFPANDDFVLGPQTLTFPFQFYGQNYSTYYISNNGILSFNANESVSTISGLNATTLPIVAPFWADIDTTQSGIVYSRTEGSRLAVAWDRVGYFNGQSDKVNTFQVVLSDGTDSSMGLGNNVCFCYNDMQWATGDVPIIGSFNGTSGGFGGIPATVGVTNGDGSSYYQVGSFSALADLAALNNKSFCFQVTENIPAPNVTNATNATTTPTIQERVDLPCDGIIKARTFVFPSVTPDAWPPSVEVFVNGSSKGLTVVTTQQVGKAVVTIKWMPKTVAEIVVTLTTDGINRTVIEETFTSPGPCCAGMFVKLWNTKTKQNLGRLVNGGSYCLKPIYDLQAASCQPGARVVMTLRKKQTARMVWQRVSNKAPYELWGTPGRSRLANGRYSLRVEAGSVVSTISFRQACP